MEALWVDWETLDTVRSQRFAVNHSRWTPLVALPVELKVTREEQEKMRQSIENKRERRAGEMSITVMFYDRSAILATSAAIMALPRRESSLSDGLTGGFV